MGCFKSTVLGMYSQLGMFGLAKHSAVQLLKYA